MPPQQEDRHRQHESQEPARVPPAPAPPLSSQQQSARRQSKENAFRPVERAGSKHPGRREACLAASGFSLSLAEKQIRPQRHQQRHQDGFHAVDAGHDETAMRCQEDGQERLRPDRHPQALRQSLRHDQRDQGEAQAQQLGPQQRSQAQRQFPEQRRQEHIERAGVAFGAVGEGRAAIEDRAIAFGQVAGVAEGDEGIVGRVDEDPQRQQQEQADGDPERRRRQARSRSRHIGGKGFGRFLGRFGGEALRVGDSHQITPARICGGKRRREWAAGKVEEKRPAFPFPDRASIGREGERSAQTVYLKLLYRKLAVVAALRMEKKSIGWAGGVPGVIQTLSPG